MSEWEAIISSGKTTSYGSCVRSVEKSSIQYVKHYLDESDTLQGLALKYDSSTDELRRINKLFNTDSIFLRDFLLVPAPLVFSAKNQQVQLLPSKPQPKSSIPEEEMDVSSFLKQLDSKILLGIKAVNNYKFNDKAVDGIANPGTAKYFKNSKSKSENSTSLSNSENADNDLLPL